VELWVYIPYNVAIDSSLPGEIYQEMFFTRSVSVAGEGCTWDIFRCILRVGVYLGCMGVIYCNYKEG
jgi:hypothetical protein